MKTLGISVGTLVGISAVTLLIQYLRYKSCYNEVMAALKGEISGISCSKTGFDFDPEKDVTSVRIRRFPFKATISRDNKTRKITAANN